MPSRVLREIPDQVETDRLLIREQRNDRIEPNGKLRNTRIYAVTRQFANA